MKKIILVFIALSIAFAISSCCDQCPKNFKGNDEKEEITPKVIIQEPVRVEECSPCQEAKRVPHERQSRRW